MLSDDKARFDSRPDHVKAMRAEAVRNAIARREVLGSQISPILSGQLGGYVGSGAETDGHGHRVFDRARELGPTLDAAPRPSSRHW